MFSMVWSTPGTGRAWHMDICSVAKSVNKGSYLNVFWIYLRKRCRALRKGMKRLLEKINCFEDHEKSLKSFKEGKIHF